MQRTIFFISLLCGIVLFAWCIKNNHPDIVIRPEIIQNQSYHSVTSWVQETASIQVIPDIVWQVVPTGQDYLTFVSSYLKEQEIYDYIIEKQAKKWNITTISMKQDNDFWCHFEGGWCIVVVFRDDQVIWSNAKNYLECRFNEQCIWGHGRFYRYTDHGVLLEIHNGEGLWCIDGITYTFQYIHLKDLKTLRSTLDIIKQWTSPDPQDERCQNPKTTWKETQSLKFFSSYAEFRNRNPLPIQAKNTEEAYYKYYNQ